MSRKVIVEEFDDDTDLPLPSRSLPSSTSGPLLEEILSDGDEPPEPSQTRTARASPESSVPRTPTSPFNPGSRTPANTVTDVTPYKTWTCIYPIYIDAKRPYGTGQRRIARQKSLWWPLALDIADACSRLGIRSLLEQQKSHPRDWENPGRVRVQWKSDGRFMNLVIRSKRQLLESIASQIQRIKPENIPRPPYNTTASRTESTSVPTSKSTSSKGKQSAAYTKVKSPSEPKVKRNGARGLPIPPEAKTPIAERLSPFSPALVSGVLVDAVTAGMNAQESATGAAPSAGAAGTQKGKRKVIRVRGPG
ncbi:signal recognition particle, SRP19 subunit [Fistulina hepatica ATCC 64428]|uniref:Signal recognition particle, SRP19 subunit n=1 Tax=Fistulina hepatica ATCC 64428 TaxID=1128425 RepID=A0A0D7A2X2_9AGAR|nr:signal recognition particle, SRP19 subunit [Fistulina hepatica ATCC 64428]